jgi:exodeoxyribonuclease VII small subunit
MPSAPVDDTTRSFEESLGELEARVRALEAGDLPLEDALRIFEEGISLTRECHEKLDAADQRLIELTRGPGEGVIEREV